MESYPRTSVIISNYNGAEVIGLCIESIINSSYRNYEIIIMDDASKDTSINVIENLINKYKNSIYINLIRNEVNLGPSESRNILSS